MDSCPEKANAVMGESRDACPAERTQLTGESIIGFAKNSSGLKSKSRITLYCFNQKKFAALPVCVCGTSVHCV